MANRHHIMRNSSAFYRLTQMYYAEKLKPYGLGPGQQYFLMQIGAHPGVTPAELAASGAFDNGTVTRAAHKLEELGYAVSERDDRDRRSKKLTLTVKGEEMLPVLREMRRTWMSAVTAGFAEEEKAMIGRLMGQLADNARAYLDGGDDR